MSFEEIFNPSLGHTLRHLSEERILPAPTPSPGDAPLADGADGVVIPDLDAQASLFPEPQPLASGADAQAPADADVAGGRDD
nr:MAG: hypothetical protein DIU73_06010 [Actinomycetota bacterium]